LIDASLGLGVLVVGELEAVERAQIVEHSAAALGRDAFGVGKIEHRVLA
jgi:hypothetical protein